MYLEYPSIIITRFGYLFQVYFIQVIYLKLIIRYLGPNLTYMYLYVEYIPTSYLSTYQVGSSGSSLVPG